MPAAPFFRGAIAKMTVKSIFVPESYLREEIRVGYDQAGGDAEPAGLVEFKPAAETDVRAEPVEDEPVEDEAESDAGEDAGPSAFLPDSDDDAVQDADDDAVQDADDDAVQDAGADGATGAGGDAPTTEIFKSLQDLDLDEPQPVAAGGGLFGSDFTTVLQTLMVSGNNMPVADILEDGVYEMNAIKSYLDSIAQSLAKIADRYAGDSKRNDRADRADRADKGSKPWNNDRGNKGNDRGRQGNDRGQDRQDRQDAEPEVEDALDE